MVKQLGDPFIYNGSGKYWKRHLQIHGNDIKTEILGYYDKEEECKKEALKFSFENDIVSSPLWANLMDENGLSGGNSTSSRIWITNDKNEILINQNEIIPEGWHKGRIFTSSFKNSLIQKNNSKKWQEQKETERYKEIKKNSLLKMIKTRDHSKCGVKGENHPCKREEVKRKIAEKHSKPIVIYNIFYSSIKDACQSLNLTRYQIGKIIQNDKNRKT